jgi:phosphoglycerol transferase
MTEVRKSVVVYLGAVIVCLGFLAWSLELWRADLSIPLAYGGDALITQLWVKGVVENGWYLTNRSVGAPFGLEMHDFPFADSAFYLVLKALSRFSADHAVVYNLYYLLTFPLSTVSALFVFRRFGVTRAPAAVGGLLFAFLPYHFLRGEHHLFLASYFLVPLGVMTVLWLYPGGGPQEVRDGVAGRPGALRTLASLAIGLLIGSGGVYYAFFTCYFLLIAGVSGALGRRRVDPLWSSGAGVALISLGVLANTAPKFVYQWQHGPNPSAVVRDPAQGEYFGLKMTQLLLPARDHRVPALARLRARYDDALAPLVNENAWSTLGLVGGVGFVSLLAGLLWRGKSGAPRLLDGLVVLNVSAVLLATMGGFGTLFGFLVSPWIRGYNRISVFIAFFSLFAVVLALAELDRRARSRGRRCVVRAGLAALLVMGLLDQTTRSFVPDYEGVKAAYKADDEFVRRIEAALPAGSMIFQLPYSRFPEPPVIHQMQWYEHLRGYLHSRSLRWSYGAMGGRYGDLWQAQTLEEPAGAMIRRLAFAGFGGVYLDRSGFADGGAALEAELTRRLSVRPLVHRDGRLAFFDLTPFAESLRRGLTPDAWAAEREAALCSVVAGWGGGFYDRQGEADGTRRWSGGFGELTLINPTHAARRVELTMTLATRAEGPSWVQVKGPGVKERFAVDGSDRLVRSTLVVPPGSTRLKFFANGRRVWPEGEHRTLVFRVDHFTISEPGPRGRGPGPADVAGGSASAARR